jgi:hypothetical protein
MSEYYPHVSRPAKGPRAFREITEVTSQSQAAILLLLARQLRGDDEALEARARAARTRSLVAPLDLPGPAAFPVPQLRPSQKLLSASDVRTRARKRFAFSPKAPLTDLARSYTAAAKRLYAQATVDSAAELMEMCLAHPRQLVRVAAAYAYYPLTSDPARCIQHLARGLRSRDRLEKELAATTLSRVQPEHPSLRALARRSRRPGRRRRAHTLTLVHGTWASTAEWYHPPAGTFFKFIKPLRPDLYSGSDYFAWSGGYSDAARDTGAVELKSWVTAHNEDGLDIMGHSHGANVIMRATQLGMTAGKVVLLSCPVHVNKYLPDFARVTKPVWSVRVKLDLVILADRGGQRFTHPDINEVILPIWFDHSASHDPQVWKDHKVAQKIGL